MCHNSNFQEDQKDWPAVGSYIIIFTCVILLLVALFVYGYRTFKNTPVVERVIVTTDLAPDSTKEYTYINFSQADSLIQTVKNYDDRLTQKYQYLVEQKEQNSQLFYWGSLIVGLVVAIFGWFGFKSFYSIEKKIAKKSIDTAKITSRNISSNYWKKEGEKLIISAAEKYYHEQVKSLKVKIKDEIATSIENKVEQALTEKGIQQIQERLDQLESEIKRLVDESVENAFDEFLETLKKNRHKGSQNKEDKEAT